MNSPEVMTKIAGVLSSFQGIGASMISAGKFMALIFCCKITEKGLKSGSC